MDQSGAPKLDFEVPPELEAREPPEARGLSRDAVRLMVAYRRNRRIVHAQFCDLPRYLESGDLLVINTSGTLPASIPVRRADGTRLDLHLSTPVQPAQAPPDLTRVPADGPETWVVELRETAAFQNRPFRNPTPGEVLTLPEGTVELIGPYPPNCGPPEERPQESRLWTATLRLPSAVGAYLERYGHPIRYGYLSREWPASYYQTVYAIEAGSAEMPSAGRAFTPEMITKLIARGVGVAPITLHAGVSSVEDHEPPLREFYRVSEETARRVMLTHEMGGRIIAVGTTAVRALETVTDAAGTVRAGEGWTTLVVSPARGVRTVDGLLTGWHEPRASHLLLLEAVAGRALLEVSYRAALEHSYLWHEFGDLHLLLP